MNITIFGKPFLDAAGRINQHSLTASAAQPYSYYAVYNYANVNTSDTRTPPGGWGPIQAHSPIEWVLRDRRVIYFSDGSLLKPIPTPSNCALLDDVRKLSICDHETVWISRRGTLFVLNEPYGNHQTYNKHVAKLARSGLTSILLPTSISPYCGGWSNVVNALPGTISYLIGYKNNAEELADIKDRLAAAVVKPWSWNDITEVRLTTVNTGTSMPPVHRSATI